MKLFFDLDGTLIDTSKRHYQVYSEVVQQFGGTPLDRDEYWEIMRFNIKWPTLLEMSELSEVVQAEFLQLFITKIESPDYLRLDTLFPSALSVLRLLADNHTCYLVSLRRNRTNLLEEIARLKLTNFFQAILSGHSEIDGYDKKIELISAYLSREEKAAIIGDTEADIVTGKQLGMQTIAVTTGIRDKAFLMDLQPDYTLVNIVQLKKIFD
jgi:phosphoglycolate phosphatase